MALRTVEQETSICGRWKAGLSFHGNPDLHTWHLCPEKWFLSKCPCVRIVWMFCILMIDAWCDRLVWRETSSFIFLPCMFCSLSPRKGIPSVVHTLVFFCFLFPLGYENRKWWCSTRMFALRGRLSSFFSSALSSPKKSHVAICKVHLQY